MSIATLENLEFRWVKFWQMTFVLPNLLKFSPARILHYTIAISLYCKKLYCKKIIIGY